MEKIDMSLDDIIKSSKKFIGNLKKGQMNRGAPKAHSAKFQRGKNKTSGKQLRKPLKGGVTKSYNEQRRVKSKQASRMLQQQVKGGTYKNQGGFLPVKRRNSTSPSTATSSKLLISNLDFGVSNQDILELFQEFGTLKKASLHFNESGKSLGSADVMFENSQDAMRALKHYNDVPLDGRPMKIQVVGDVKKPSSLRSRLGPVLKRGGMRGTQGSGNIRKGGFGNNNRKINPVQAPNRGNGKRRFAGNNRKPTHSRESLDAQLDAYTSKK